MLTKQLKNPNLKSCFITRLFLPLQPIKKWNAGVAKLADALDLGSSAARHGGSSPFARTFLTL